MPPSLTDLPDAPRNIQAIDDQGLVWSLREDSEVGDWLRYLADGGTIDPVEEPVPQIEPNVLQDAPVEE